MERALDIDSDDLAVTVVTGMRCVLTVVLALENPIDSTSTLNYYPKIRH